MKTFYFNARMNKMRWSFAMIAVLLAFPGTVLSQVAAKNPLCDGEPIQLMCNFTEGCSNPGTIFTWHNTSGSWTTNVRDPVLYPPGGFEIGDGQTASGSLCNGEGYATDSIFLTIHYAPPPGGVQSGSVHVMINAPYVDISGTAYAFIVNQYYPLNGGHATLFNSIYGVLDTLATVPVNSAGQFTVHNTCGVDGSPILIIPNGNSQMPTYLGDAVSWNDATAVVASSTVNVGAIHMINYIPQNIPGAASFMKGIVYRITPAKANDPIDNVGVVIKKNSSVMGYATSDDDGLFTLGKFEQGTYRIYSNYPGIPMDTMNGANIVKTFNPLDTINLTIKIVSNPIMTDSNFVRVYPAYVVSPTCNVQNETTNSGEKTCYNALQTLTVSGTQSVIVHNGGTLDFIAGNKIDFKPGFRAESGAHVWGHITTTGQYCNQVPGLKFSAGDMTTAGKEETQTARAPSLDQHVFFNAYPNPTSGAVTLELSADPGESIVSVTCYNEMGSLVMEKEYHAGKKHELSLAGHAPGIYLLKVRVNGETGLKKIIKQ